MSPDVTTQRPFGLSSGPLFQGWREASDLLFMDDGLTYPELALQLLQLLGTSLIALSRLRQILRAEGDTVAHVLPGTDAHEPTPGVIEPGGNPTKGRPMLCQRIGWRG